MEAVNKPQNISYKGVTDLVTEWELLQITYFRMYIYDICFSWIKWRFYTLYVTVEQTEFTRPTFILSMLFECIFTFNRFSFSHSDQTLFRSFQVTFI